MKLSTSIHPAVLEKGSEHSIVILEFGLLGNLLGTRLEVL